MRHLFPILFVILTACGGTLTEEQRQSMKEKMELNAIKKVSEAQLMDAAFSYGRKVKDQYLRSLSFDAIEKEFSVKVIKINDKSASLLPVESRIIEAYSDIQNRQNLSDNVQEMGRDSLIYTYPVITEKTDTTFSLNYVLSIHIPVKAVVLSIDE